MKKSGWKRLVRFIPPPPTHPKNLFSKLIDFYFQSKTADQRLSMRSKDIINMQLNDVIENGLKSINTIKVQENLKLKFPKVISSKYYF